MLAIRPIAVHPIRADSSYLSYKLLAIGYPVPSTNLDVTAETIFAFGSSGGRMINFVSRQAVVWAAACLAFSACLNGQNTSNEASQQTAPAETSAPSPESTPIEPISIELFYWLTRAEPVLRSGKADTSTLPGNLDFPGRSKYSPGGVISIPAGQGNALRVSYLQTIGTGNTTAAADLNLFSTGYNQGDYLATQYKLRNVKISYDFLSYPTPLGDSSWRFRTLWQVEYTSVKTTIDAPLKPISVDSSGTAISNTGAGDRWFIFPTFGAALDKTLARHFIVEGRASGFGIPHRAATWDAEASARYQIGRVDVIAGYRGFYFKTSPQGDQYIRGLLAGASVGLRYNFR
jgi:hypothetical protein